MRTEDGYIVQKCLNGEPEAFGLLVDKYKASIYAFAYVKLRNFHDAEDVAQEVFIKAYQKLRHLRRYDSFLAWLYSIASDLCRKWIRSQSKRPDREFIEDQSPEVREGIATDSYREDLVYESLHEVLNSLPEIYQQVLTLYYLGGMNSREIARFLGTSPAAIRQRLSRARVQLKKEVLAMTSATFEGQRLQASFTFRIVEAVRRIRIHPMPRAIGLPWGLSLAAGIIITVMSFNPHLSITSDMATPKGLPLPVESKVLKTGEIPVHILKTSEISVISSKQGNGDGGKPQFQVPQNALMLAPYAEGGMWAKKADMQVLRFQHNSCALDGQIYAIGGRPATNGPKGPRHSTVERYNPETNTWTFVADMPIARFAHTANAVDGRIYVIGGDTEGGHPLRPVPILIYDPAKDQWSEKDSMPVGSFFHGSAVVNEKIYLIGGMDSADSAVSTVYEYDPKVDIWTQKADMPTPRCTLGTAAVNGRIYAIAGAVNWSEGPELKTVEEYDPVTDTWTRKADMLFARWGVSAVALDGKLYAIGGEEYIGKDAAGAWIKAFHPPEVYDPATGTWTELVDMQVPRMMLSSSAVNGKIYAIGGTDKQEILSTVEEYTPEGWRAISPQGKLPTKWGEIK